MKSVNRWWVGATTCLALSPSAFGQGAADSRPGQGSLEEVIVTAEKRSENLQSVPATVNVLTATDLERAGRDSLRDLAGVVPGLTATGANGGNFIFLRGVGQYQSSHGIESPVAMYVDGVYLFSQLGGVMSLNNIEQIEVLKGPQGTLFGRNATGGVIQVFTKQPSQTPALETEVGYGNHETVSARLYGTTGVADNIAASLAISGKDRGDGFARNLTTGNDAYKEKDFSAQLKLLYTSPDDTRITFNTLYDYTKNGSAQVGIVPGYRGSDNVTTYIDRYTISQRVDAQPSTDQSLFSLKLEHDFDWGTLVNIASKHLLNQGGYQQPNGVSGNNINPVTGQLGKASVFHVSAEGDTLTEEFQLQAPADRDFQWVAGVFLLRDKSENQQLAYDHEILTARMNSEVKTESIAGFAQATKTVLPKTALTFGVRYTQDQLEFAGVSTTAPVSPEGRIPTEIEESKVTYRVSVDHQLTDQIMAYASYNTGFRAGRFVINNFSNPPVRPETIESVEIGLKTQLFDQRLRLNTALYTYTYDQLQVRGVNTDGTSRTLNAAKAEARGVDVDFEAMLTGRFRIGGGVAYFDGEYESFPGAFCPTYNPTTAAVNANVICDLSGAPMARSPEWSGVLRLSHEIPTRAGAWQLSVEDSYSDRFTFEPDGRLSQPSYHNVSADVTWTHPSDRWSVSLWGSNLLDEFLYATQATGASLVYVPGDPRLYGVSVGAKF